MPTEDNGFIFPIVPGVAPQKVLQLRSGKLRRI
jgi:hypothetical protein